MPCNLDPNLEDLARLIDAPSFDHDAGRVTYRTIEQDDECGLVIEDPHAALMEVTAQSIGTDEYLFSLPATDPIPHNCLSLPTIQELGQNFCQHYLLFTNSLFQYPLRVEVGRNIPWSALGSGSRCFSTLYGSKWVVTILTRSD